ncbi:MAG: DUF835 domain-containing protein [Candidatus Thermoplasmatota archaeon]|nr:DUF835 domain-containing protein [Candidatus Thermoplasmatota archaeon]
MSALRSFSAAVLVFLLLACSSAPASSAQDEDDVMAVKSHMLLSGIGSLSGSVDIQVTFSGSAAEFFRDDIFQTFDVGSHANNLLNVAETRMFLQNVSAAMHGRIYWGIQIESMTDFTSVDESDILSMTSGLVSSTRSDPSPIMFSLSFEGSGLSTTKEIETAQSVYSTLADSIEAVTGFRFEGTMQLDHRVTTLVLGSFTDPEITEGDFTSVRLPTGSILWYSYDGDVGPTFRARGMITYRDFSVMENQVIGFLVLLLGGIMIMKAPGKYFDKFEKLHPKKFRKHARPLTSVRLSAYVLTAVIAVLYFLPFIFDFVSPNALVYVWFLYFLVPLAVIGEHFFSRFMYNRAALSIPDESVIEMKQAVLEPEKGQGEMMCRVCFRPIEAGLDLFQSTCGATMHVDCAEKVQNCPVCGELLFPQRTRSIQCRSCGETFLYTGSEDSYSIQCPKCGMFQEEIAPGKNYLVVAEDPRNAFMMIRAISLSERPTMVMTSQFPGKLRSDYDLGEMEIKWFSDSETDIDNLDPKALDEGAMEVASTFLMTTKKAGILLEGLDALIDASGFDKVLSFMKKLNDLASIHGSTVILAVDKNELTEGQYRAISEDFDEIHDFGA